MLCSDGSRRYNKRMWRNTAFSQIRNRVKKRARAMSQYRIIIDMFDNNIIIIVCDRKQTKKKGIKKQQIARREAKRK